MSINPVSDIILDVARAANPGKSSAATERLWKGGAAEPDASEFSRLIRQGDSSDAGLRGRAELMSAKPSTPAPGPADARTKAMKGIEQLVLKNLVESMLPQEESGLFGAGTAGDVWRSMLAEQLANQIGQSVDLGIVNSSGAGRSGAHEPSQVEPLGEARINRRS